MKYSLILYSLLLPVFLLSQEIKFSSHLGYAIGKTPIAKKVMLYTGANAGIEMRVGKKDLYLSVAPGFSVLRFDFTNDIMLPVFNSKYFFNLPVSLKKYYPFSKRSWGFWDFGVFASYFYRDKKETTLFNGTNTEKEKKHDINIGGEAQIGFKTMITPVIFFDIGLTSQSDFYLHYENAADKIRTEKKMLTLSLYRKL